MMRPKGQQLDDILFFHRILGLYCTLYWAFSSSSSNNTFLYVVDQVPYGSNVRGHRFSMIFVFFSIYLTAAKSIYQSISQVYPGKI